ncbi:Sodium/hydrogen exchanger family protein [Candidatus Magnetomoraceae bacterium gMMP-15]
MIKQKNYKINEFYIHLTALIIILVFAFWVKNIDLKSSWQQAGLMNFSLGIVMLAAYVIGQICTIVRLPLISGYILTGILAGPYITCFLSKSMVQDMKLIDDLALSFIALAAGGSFNLKSLSKRSKAIILNITLLTLLVFTLIFSFVVGIGPYFSFTRSLSSPQLISLAMLLGVVAVARSPSSAIAIISETRAKGIFTETVLGVTVAMDVLIIIFFTLAITLANITLNPGANMDIHVFLALSLEIMISISVGLASGKIISLYIERVGYDLPVFLLFFAFSVSKTSLWLNHEMQSWFDISLHLEPLLICMSAGFTVQNLSKSGFVFMETLERISLPIYVLFFSLAGASLNLDALCTTWALALCLAVVRALGIFSATWLAGTITKEPARNNRIAWMAYLTQAGVAIGLAQLAERQFPEIGIYLTTVVLAVITINQIIGPITFKAALNLVGDAGRK